MMHYIFLLHLNKLWTIINITKNTNEYNKEEFMKFNTDLLKKLTSITSPPGRECALAEYIQSELVKYNVPYSKDTLGNIIAHKKGNGKKIMFAAHMDQIGMMVTKITEDGFIKFFNLGGLIPPTLISQRVVTQSGIEGVINTSKLNLESLSIEDLYIDIGSTNKEMVEKHIKIGDVFGFKNDYYEYENTIISSSIDDRIGCYILMELMKLNIESDYDIYYTFTVQEEVGTRGALTSGYAINPDIAISVDITPAGDSPAIKFSNTAIGKGVTIKVMDPTLIVPANLVDTLIKAAEDAEIKYQLEIMERGGTDSGTIHTLNGGVLSGVLSIPTRNQHTASELISKYDVIETIKLIKYMLENQKF